MRFTLLVLLLLLAAPAAAKERPPAKPSTVKAAASSNLATRQAAIDELNGADPATIPAGLAAELLDIVKHSSDTKLRESALQLLGHMGPRAHSKQAQRILVSFLDLREKAPPGRIRGWAAWALGKSGAPVKEVGLTLLGMTGPYDEFTRAAALEGFVELGGDVPGFLRIAMAASEPSHLRATMIRLLASFPPEEGGLGIEESKSMLASAHRTEREPLVFAIARGTPATRDGAKQLAELLAVSKGYFERRLLLKRLEELGPTASVAGPALCDLLRDPDASIFDVSDTLIAIGPTAETACATVALRPRFATDNAYTVAQTAAHLGDPGLALLIWGLKHDNPEVRSASLITIGAMKPPPSVAFEDVRRLTRDPTPYAAPTAINALAAYGARGQRHMVSLFESGSAESRSAAARHLGIDQWDVLFAAIDDPEVSDTVLHRLSQLGQHPERVIPHIFAKKRFLHEIAPLAIAFGPAGAEVVLRLLKSRDAEKRRAAAYTLSSFEPRPANAIRPLELALDDEDEDTRMWAASSLGSFGSAAAAAGPSLRSALLDPSYRVREQAASSLGHIGFSEAEPDLLALLSDRATPTAVRVGALEGLVALGTPAAHNALVKTMSDDNDYLRGQAATGLRNFAATPPTLDVLRTALDDPDRSVRVSAAHTLKKLGNAEDRLRASAVIRKDGGLRFIEAPTLD